MEKTLSQIIDELRKIQEQHGDKIFKIHDHMAPFDDLIDLDTNNPEIDDNQIIFRC